MSRNFFINTAFIALLLGVGFYFRESIERFSYFILSQYMPCKYPITYSIGGFDPKFGVTEQDFKASIAQAEKVWERVTGTELFQYEEKGGIMKVNLVYDDRQEATDKMKELGIVIGSDRKSYDSLKTKYDAMKASYESGKKSLDQAIAQFETRKAAYEKEVAYWNARGGAPKAKHASLETEQASLSAEAARINTLQQSLNGQASELNALGNEINKLARNLNIKVDAYNETGNHGEEFSEGEYIREGFSQNINIYQFESKTKLLRVLAHELGHALGLDHVEDQKAIMYRLNQSTNEKPTLADVAALKTLCRIN